MKVFKHNSNMDHEEVSNFCNNSNVRDSFGKFSQFSTSFLADDFDICHGIEIPASTTEFSDLSMVFGGWMDSCLFESETSFNRALLPQQSHLAKVASDLVQKYLDGEGFIDLDELINNSNIDEERPADAQQDMSGVECLMQEVDTPPIMHVENSSPQPKHRTIPPLIRIEEPEPYSELTSPCHITPIPTLAEICDYYKSLENFVSPISDNIRHFDLSNENMAHHSSQDKENIAANRQLPELIPIPRFRITSKIKFRSPNVVKKPSKAKLKAKSSPAEIIKQKMKDNYMRNRYAAEIGNVVEKRYHTRNSGVGSVAPWKKIETELPYYEKVKAKDENANQVNDPEKPKQVKQIDPEGVECTLSEEARVSLIRKLVAAERNKPRLNLICPKCSKTYVMQKMFLDHVLLCNGPKLVNISNVRSVGESSKPPKVTAKAPAVVATKTRTVSSSNHYKTRAVTRSLTFD